MAEEVRLSCTQAMLLSLDRDQRLSWILAEIFELAGDEAAAILEIDPATHRKRLAAGNARDDANGDLAELQDERPFVSHLMLVRRFDEHARPAHVYHVGKRARQLGVASDGHAIGPRPLNCHKETLAYSICVRRRTGQSAD